MTMPDMQVSTDLLEFGPVQCGQCKVVTIQLFNHNKVKCEWTSLPTEKEKRLVRFNLHFWFALVCEVKGDLLIELYVLGKEVRDSHYTTRVR